MVSAFTSEVASFLAATQWGLREATDIVKEAPTLVCESWPARDAGKYESAKEVSGFKDLWLNGVATVRDSGTARR